MIPVDQIASLALFARVVQHRSFSAAAREAGLAKSAVSRRIAELERALGVRLLHRTTRSLSLTEEGVRVHEHASALVTAADAAQDVAGIATGAVRGTLRLNATVAFSQLYLAAAVARFLALAPRGGGPPGDRRATGRRGRGRLRRGVPHRAADRLEPGRPEARHRPAGGLRLAGLPRARRHAARARRSAPARLPPLRARPSSGRMAISSGRAGDRGRHPRRALLHRRPEPPRGGPRRRRAGGRPLDAGGGRRGGWPAAAGAGGSAAGRDRHPRRHRAPDTDPAPRPGAARLPAWRTCGPAARGSSRCSSPDPRRDHEPFLAAPGSQRA